MWNAKPCILISAVISGEWKKIWLGINWAIELVFCDVSQRVCLPLYHIKSTYNVQCPLHLPSANRRPADTANIENNEAQGKCSRQVLERLMTVAQLTQSFALYLHQKEHRGISLTTFSFTLTVSTQLSLDLDLSKSNDKRQKPRQSLQ